MVFALTRLPTLDPARSTRFMPVATLSPFHYCYANPKTVLRLAAGRFFAHYNGEDIAATYWALRRAAVLYDVPERPVEISGPQAVPFLDRIFTRRQRLVSAVAVMFSPARMRAAYSWTGFCFGSPMIASGLFSRMVNLTVGFWRIVMATM